MFIWEYEHFSKTDLINSELVLWEKSCDLCLLLKTWTDGKLVSTWTQQRQRLTLLPQMNVSRSKTKSSDSRAEQILVLAISSHSVDITNLICMLHFLSGGKISPWNTVSTNRCEPKGMFRKCCVVYTLIHCDFILTVFIRNYEHLKQFDHNTE